MTTQEMDGSSWKRPGCSIVWSPDLLGPILREADDLASFGRGSDRADKILITRGIMNAP